MPATRPRRQARIRPGTPRGIGASTVPLVEQVIGPLHRAFEGGLTLAGATLAAREQPEPVVEPAADLVDVHAAGPRRGELDREWDAVELRNDLDHRGDAAASLAIVAPAARARSTNSRKPAESSPVAE